VDALTGRAALLGASAAAAATLAAAGGARAQGGPPAAAAAGPDTAAVLAVVRGLFDAMRAGDSARVRASFAPGALLGTARERDGRPVFERDSLETFARAVGTPHADVWDERLRNTAVRVDGPLAAVWTEYAFYAGPRFSHCGVDAFQLARTAAGWRIVALVDTRRRTGCPEQAPAR
jgi:hypothetical protein